MRKKKYNTCTFKKVRCGNTALHEKPLFTANATVKKKKITRWLTHSHALADTMCWLTHARADTFTRWLTPSRADSHPHAQIHTLTRWLTQALAETTSRAG